MSKRKLARVPADILEVDDLATEIVEVPEWDCDISITELNGVDLQRISALVSMSDESTTFDVMDMATICALCIRNEDGERVFDDDDIEALAMKKFKVLVRIFNAALALSGLTKQSVEAEKKG